jgi:hypothetical protein
MTLMNERRATLKAFLVFSGSSVNDHIDRLAGNPYGFQAAGR